MRVHGCCFVFLFALAAASAQESASPPISTERPTAGYSPDVIPGGSLQMETGAGVNAQMRRMSADLPESLLRVGFSERCEARFQSSNAVYESQPAANVPRLETADAAVSGKCLIGRADGLLPRSGVIDLSLPTGGPAQSSGSRDPGGALIWTQSARRGYTFNEVAIGTLTTLHGARRPVWAPSVYAGKSLNERVSVFAELAPTVLQDRSTTWLADSGVAWLTDRNRQVDFRAGYFHDGGGRHTLVSVGVSLRREDFLKKPRFLPIGR